MIEIHNFRTGDTVSVINYSNVTGRYYIEGTAGILATMPQEGMYIVRFQDGHEAERYVDPNQLDIPAETLIKKLNTKPETREP